MEEERKKLNVKRTMELNAIFNKARITSADRPPFEMGERVHFKMSANNQNLRGSVFAHSIYLLHITKIFEFSSRECVCMTRILLLQKCQHLFSIIIITTNIIIINSTEINRIFVLFEIYA